jgi:hypothetical protein
MELTMAVLFSTLSQDAAHAYLASIAAEWPLAECRPNGDAWEVHDLPHGYFSGPVFDGIVERAVAKVLEQLQQQSG